VTVAQGNGIWIGGEIRGSGNPVAHAHGIVANMIKHGIDWACVQIEPDEMELQLLVGAAGGTRAIGGWSQNIAPQESRARMSRAPGVSFFSINAESANEEQKWTTSEIKAMQAQCPDGVSLIFQQGAMDYKTPGNARSPESKAVARRWIDLGVDAIPEAIQSENPNATIANMMQMCADLGWPASRTAPALYLNRDYPASGYSSQISLTGGRWSVYRYGDIDETDWNVMAGWPSPSAPPPVEPPPPLPTMTVMEAHGNTRYGVQAVRNKGVTLGRAASLTLQDRLALGAISGAHDATKGASIANMLDQLGYPQV
jgi:hypothetical protein